MEKREKKRRNAFFFYAIVIGNYSFSSNVCIPLSVRKYLWVFSRFLYLVMAVGTTVAKMVYKQRCQKIAI